MTERVYYASDATEGRAQIIGCRAEADGRYAIDLIVRCFIHRVAANRRIAAGSTSRS